MQDSNWSQRKKLSIYILFFLILLSISIFAYFKYQEYKTPIPSCNDNIQNQDEKGIDCEGICVIICKNNIRPIKSLYTKIIPSKYGVYDIVSMIENTNIGKSTGLQAYKIKIYNTNREKIKEIEGEIYIPDATRFPIILLNQRIDRDINNNVNDSTSNNVNENINNETIKSVNNDVKFADIELVNQNYIPVNKHINRVKVIDYKYNNQEKKLYIKLKNITLDKSNKLTVKALILNDTGVIAINESKVKYIDGGDEVEVNMTWYESLENLNNYRVEIYVFEDN